MVIKTDLTDHDFCILGVPSIKRRQTTHKRLRDITDYPAVISSLESIDWCNVLQSNNADEAAGIFSEVFTSTISNNTKVKSVPRSKFNIKPWITPGLIRCQKHRDFLHRQAKNNKQDMVSQIIYKRYRNFLTNLQCRIKSEYENKQLTDNQKNSKKLWRVIKDICNIPKPQNAAIELIKSKDPKKSLSECNRYFASVGESLAKVTLTKIKKDEEALAANLTLNNSPQTSLFLSPTDVHEVRDLIKEMYIDSSPGFDRCTPRLIKQLCPTVCLPLTHIYNLSLSTGKFAEIWKLGVVTPIHKDGCKTTPSNYRPITLLSIFSKLLEKLVSRRMSDFLEKHSLISDKQFGFRRNRSTEDAVAASLLDKNI